MFKSKAFIVCCLSFIQLMPFRAISGTDGGAIAGGGGDFSEIRVHEIREDLLNWILAGGADHLVLPDNLGLQEYKKRMIKVLQPKVVAVEFTDNPRAVMVGDAEKSCKGYLTPDSGRPNILCHRAKFENLAESSQYKLIHHEFAGLVMLEKNQGPASDYSISSQITQYLEYKRVLRLAVKSSVAPKEEYRKEFEARKYEDFGYLPLTNLLSDRTYDCQDPMDIDHCRLPAIKDYQYEIDSFEIEKTKRLFFVNEGLKIFNELADKLLSVRGIDATKKSFAVYSQAAEKVRATPSSIAYYNNAKEVFLQNNIQFVQAIQNIIDLNVQMDARITRALSAREIDDLMKERNLQVSKALVELRESETFGVHFWQSIEKEFYSTLQSDYLDKKIETLDTFDLTNFLNYSQVVSRKDIPVVLSVEYDLSYLKKVKIFFAKQENEYSNDPQEKYYSQFEFFRDHQVIQKIIDSTKPLQVQIVEVGALQSLRTRYDAKSNILSRPIKIEHRLTKPTVYIVEDINLISRMKELLAD